MHGDLDPPVNTTATHPTLNVHPTNLDMVVLVQHHRWPWELAIILNHVSRDAGRCPLLPSEGEIKLDMRTLNQGRAKECVEGHGQLE